MSKTRVVAIAATLLIVGSIDYLLQPPPVKIQPFLPGIIYKRSWLETNCRGAGRDIEKCRATVDALSGSGEAALRLARDIAQGDLSGRHYWLHIAAQYGSPEGMRRLAQALNELPDATYGIVHHIRARYWLERAAQAGDLEAKNLMTEIPVVSEAEAAEKRIPNAANPNPELICSPMPWWRVFAVLWGDIDYRLLSSDFLACKDIPRFEEAALRGKNSVGTSASALAFYITFTQQPQHDDQAIYWDLTGVENGITASWYNIGILWDRDRIWNSNETNDVFNPDERIRAKYWLRQSALKGDDMAALSLKRVDKLDLTSEWLNEAP